MIINTSSTENEQSIPVINNKIVTFLIKKTKTRIITTSLPPKDKSLPLRMKEIGSDGKKKSKPKLKFTILR